MVAVGEKNPALLEFGARDFAFSLCNIYIGSLLVANALSASNGKATAAGASIQNAELLALR